MLHQEDILSLQRKIVSNMNQEHFETTAPIRRTNIASYTQVGTTGQKEYSYGTRNSIYIVDAIKSAVQDKDRVGVYNQVDLAISPNFTSTICFPSFILALHLLILSLHFLRLHTNEYYTRPSRPSSPHDDNISDTGSCHQDQHDIALPCQ